MRAEKNVLARVGCAAADPKPKPVAIRDRTVARPLRRLGRRASAQRGSSATVRAGAASPRRAQDGRPPQDLRSQQQGQPTQIAQAAAQPVADGRHPVADKIMHMKVGLARVRPAAATTRAGEVAFLKWLNSSLLEERSGRDKAAP